MPTVSIVELIADFNILATNPVSLPWVSWSVWLAGVVELSRLAARVTLGLPHERCAGNSVRLLLPAVLGCCLHDTAAAII